MSVKTHEFKANSRRIQREFSGGKRGAQQTRYRAAALSAPNCDGCRGSSPTAAGRASLCGSYNCVKTPRNSHHIRRKITAEKRARKGRKQCVWARRGRIGRTEEKGAPERARTYGGRPMDGIFGGTRIRNCFELKKTPKHTVFRPFVDQKLKTPYKNQFRIRIRKLGLEVRSSLSSLCSVQSSPPFSSPFSSWGFVLGCLLSRPHAARTPAACWREASAHSTSTMAAHPYADEQHGIAKRWLESERSEKGGGMEGGERGGVG